MRDVFSSFVAINVAGLVALALSSGCAPPVSGDDSMSLGDAGRLGGVGGAKPTATEGKGGTQIGGSGGESVGESGTMGRGSPSGGMFGTAPRDGGMGDAPERGINPIPPGKVALSEIMYHAAAEDTAIEEHEFIEIYNRSSTAVSLAGWTLGGKTVAFTFPAGADIAPMKHLVIAKNPRALAAVAAYKLNAADLLGPYKGELDNGGDRVLLIDGAGEVVDQVKYSDNFPWPIGADALGVGEGWLPVGDRPLSKHKYMGRSLERISFDTSAALLVNWNASPLDGATPGAPNSVSGLPKPVVESQSVIKAMGAGLIGPTDAVIARATFSTIGTVKDVQVEYFIDDIEQSDEAPTKVSMAITADGYRATLPAQKINSVVRYRFRGDRGGGDEVISPRPSDPNSWFGYFVTPGAMAGKTRAYGLFISKANWNTLWTNIKHLRVSPKNTAPPWVFECKENATFNDKLPAVFVSDNQVFDVMARYQGSPYNRVGGPNIVKWPAGQAPTAGPIPFRAFSWLINMPRYAPLDGTKRSIILGKRANECSGFTTGIGGLIHESVGIPSSRTGYARFFINGNYYHYMTEIEHADGDMMTRFFGKDHVVGDLFKAVGYNGEQGPYTWADGRELVAGCGYTAQQRYTFNWKRQSLDYKTNSDEVMKLIHDLNVARAGGIAAMRAFFADNFDVKLMTSYIAIINWMAPWDDFFQNHYMYRKADGKWMMIPWDFDLMFGGYVPSGGSFYVGELNDRSNRVVDVKWNSYLKDAFIKSYRTELQARWRELSAKELSSATVNKLIDSHNATYDVTEAKASGTGAACDSAPFVARMKKFSSERNARIAAGMFN